METFNSQLIEYVYKNLLKTEIAKNKCKHCSGNTYIYLNGIKNVDKLPCDVFIGLNFRNYFIKIQSDELIEEECEPFMYYTTDILEYNATKDYEEELEKKEKNLGNKNRMKIIKKEDVALAIDKTINILKDLKFNNFRGLFEEDIIHYNVYEVFKCSNIEIEEGEECAVCYERTVCKTWCNHTICYRCREKIPSVDNVDGSKDKPCPICRTDIIYPS